MKPSPSLSVKSVPFLPVENCASGGAPVPTSRPGAPARARTRGSAPGLMPAGVAVGRVDGGQREDRRGGGEARAESVRDHLREGAALRAAGNREGRRHEAAAAVPRGVVHAKRARAGIVEEDGGA